MVRRRGPRLTLAEKTELWRRWRQGESLNAIGRALGRIAHVVRYEVARTGGIPPPVRHRASLALTLAEREVISCGLARGTSLRQVSRQLLRPVQSVAARDQREHEWLTAPVSAEGDRPRPLHTGSTESDRARAQYAATQDTRLSDAGRYTRGNRCIDRLNARGEKGTGLCTTRDCSTRREDLSHSSA